jgi:COP9 signalosome complex subunit 1
MVALEHSRVRRLANIARLCPPLALDALHLAIPTSTKAKDTQQYLDLVKLLHSLKPDDEMATVDSEWVTKTNKLNEHETERLEHELRGYKNNLIKESIRMGQEDLGTHFLAMNKLEQATKAYHKMREYCTTPKHIAEMTLKLAYINIVTPNWISAVSSAQKARSLTLRPEDKPRFESVSQAVIGLGYLGSANFGPAALAFLAVDPSYSTIGPVANIDFAHTMTANDIAVYGGLCALASMDRQQLQRSVLENPNFRNFLELEPHIRRAISFFCGAKYSQCLAILEAYRNDYLLDIFLGPHVNTLYHLIRSKSIVQYFVPFSQVTLSALTDAFPKPGGTSQMMEAEIVDMIQRGILDARIDTVDSLLIAPPKDSRAEAHRGVIDTADEIEHSLRLKLHRINMVQAGLEIQAPKQQQNKAKNPVSSSWGPGQML